MTAIVYLVGGAVRDLAIGKTPKDLDYVVVGSTPDEMLELGFKQVGADFPVFLHPITSDEYALARTEKKVSEGYSGFDCEWKGVRLEEDLSRRDLTINSMAMFVSDNLKLISESDENIIPNKIDGIIDYFEGMIDIEQKSLRHTTQAFSEDPLRVLRVARFLARFGDEWQIHYSTKLMMKKIHNSGELEKLTAERVWKETEKALTEKSPELFFEVFQKLGLGVFHELNDLRGVEQRADHHPEIDTFVHTMLCLKEGVKLNLSSDELFAVLTHDLGKRTAMDEFGKLHGHEAMGIPLLESMRERIKIHNKAFDLAKIVAEHHTRVHTVFQSRPKSVFKILEVTDAIRKKDRFESFLKCCEADAKGRLGFENRDYPQRAFMMKVLEVAIAVDVKPIVADQEARWKTKQDEAIEKFGIDAKVKPIGFRIKQAVRIERIAAIRKLINDMKE